VEYKTESGTVIKFVENFSVPKQSTGAYNRLLNVPQMTPSFSKICPIIELSHSIVVSLLNTSKDV
jgi:hypothetical protein